MNYELPATVCLLLFWMAAMMRHSSSESA